MTYEVGKLTPYNSHNYLMLCRKIGTTYVTGPRSGCLLQWKRNSWDRCCWEARWFIQVPAPWENTGLFSQSLSPPLSAGRSFYKKGVRKQNKEIKGRGLKSSLHVDKHNPFIRESQNWSSNGLVHVILVFIILHPWLKIRKSPGVGIPEGQILYLWN